MLPLTNEQRIKVEENMGLVGKVIQDCVHTLEKGCVYDYDDLFQIGCIGLCKAAQSDRPRQGSAFSTYAYCLIRNEIFSQLEYATRRGREVATDPEELPCVALEEESLEQIASCAELMGILDRAESAATGVTLKGVQAVRLLANGYPGFNCAGAGADGTARDRGKRWNQPEMALSYSHCGGHRRGWCSGCVRREEIQEKKEWQEYNQCENGK